MLNPRLSKINSNLKYLIHSRILNYSQRLVNKNIQDVKLKPNYSGFWKMQKAYF